MNKFAMLCAMLFLTGCGQEDDSPKQNENAQQQRFASVLAPSQQVAANCSSKASANDALFRYLQHSYYWNQELPLQFQAQPDQSLQETLYSLRNPVDVFSDVTPIETYTDKFVEGRESGFGFYVVHEEGDDYLQVSQVSPFSPAAQVTLDRGDRIVVVNNKPIKAYFEPEQEESLLSQLEKEELYLEWEKPDGRHFSAIIRQDVFPLKTVQKTKIFSEEDQQVGYLAYDAFIAENDEDLDIALAQLAGVDQLILDLRYNAGGSISAAAILASQIGGAPVHGKRFAQYTFNENLKDHQTEILFDAKGSSLLNIKELVVLTTEKTCSASELVINSLKPFEDHIKVTTVGTNTCGKPMGMYPQQICDSMVYSINFQITNALNEAGYHQGGIAPDIRVEESIVADWGDRRDPLINAALTHLTSQKTTVDKM
ncbi:S41 family peptidase [Algicola sagamiensis]|uniref:S41 family peptidase n=1 Tax=Algicola sagamiensis TaxID=163869 RepID=UPI00037505C0|nr:S41 family peptidase [Algicola sagamiensis]